MRTDDATRATSRERRRDRGKRQRATRELTWFALPLSDFERGIIGELFRRGSFASVDALVLAGLYSLARQLDVDVPVEAFEMPRAD